MGQTSSHYGGNSSKSSGSTRTTKRNSKYNRSFSIRHPSISKKVSDLKKDGTTASSNAYERLKNAKNQNQNQFNNSNKCGTLPLVNSGGGGDITMKNFNPDDLQSSDTSEILLRNVDLDDQPSVRPITISEISQNQNIQNSDNKQLNQVTCVGATETNPTTNSANINNNINNNNNKSANNSKKDIYMVSEGYHKTDSCYYKTPDGGYHKLPPDSYHKMSEICYNKLADGSFKRLIDIQNGKAAMNGGTLGSDGATNQSGTNQKKIGNQMIRFLKRSKTHTPATAKDTYTNYRREMHRTKEKERLMLLKQTENCSGSSNSATFTSNNQKHGNDHTNSNSNSANHNNNRHTHHSGNRKVVVTMMENGGLPIIATSKSKAPKGHSNSNRDKVILIRIKSNECRFFVSLAYLI